MQKLNIARNKIISEAGKNLRFRYYTVSTGSVWDDETTLTLSGVNYWLKGLVLPVNLNKGSSDSILVEQGLLVPADQKIFVNGSVLFNILNGSIYELKIQIGSPTGKQYELIQPGVIENAFADTPIYKKAYVRYLPTGSLSGE